MSEEKLVRNEGLPLDLQFLLYAVDRKAEQVCCTDREKTDRQTGRLADRHNGRRADRQTDMETGRERTEKQRDRATGRQRDRGTNTDTEKKGKKGSDASHREPQREVSVHLVLQPLPCTCTPHVTPGTFLRHVQYLHTSRPVPSYVTAATFL